MRVILVGSTGFGNEALRALLRAGGRVGVVVTRREDGAAPRYPERDLAEEAREHGIPVFEDTPLTDEGLQARMKEVGAELLVLAGAQDRLTAKVIRMASRLAVGVHPSLLPDGRGPTPTSWALIEGRDTAGVSLYELTPRPFDGRILDRQPHAIGPDDTDGSLRRSLAALSGAMLEAYVRALAAGTPPPDVPFEASEATTYPACTRRDALISFDDASKNIHNRIRGTNPRPGAHLVHEGREIPIVGSRLVPGHAYEVKAGLIVDRVGEFHRVKTEDGFIEIRLGEGHEHALPVGTVLGEPPAAPVQAPSGSRTGNIAHTRERYGLDEGAEEFPRMVVLAVAYPCNARCPNCPYTEGNSDIRKHYADAPFVDPELFKKIARECGPHNAWVRITGGGEPMLHPADLVSLIEYAKEQKARVWLNTNGSCFTDEKMDRLLRCGLDQVEFSVDAADPETYAKVRPGLDFDRLVKSVRFMLERRRELQATTNIIVSVINQDLLGGAIDQVAQFWLDLGVDEVVRRKFLTWGANTTLDKQHSADESPYLDKMGGDPCPFPFHRLNVDSRGKIEVCGYDISGRTNFGSVREKTISEIWRGPIFEWWRRMHLERRGREIPLCRECPDWAYRSWNHNWQKVVKTASTHRDQVVGSFETDEAGIVSERVGPAAEAASEGR